MDAPSPTEASPTISEATRRRMAELERTRPAIEHPIRHAIAFALGVGILGALLDHYAPWETD